MSEGMQILFQLCFVLFFQMLILLFCFFPCCPARSDLIGSRPVWTDDGCETKIDGDNITCLISHLTYFAILLVSSAFNTVPEARVALLIH